MLEQNGTIIHYIVNKAAGMTPLDIIWQAKQDHCDHVNNIKLPDRLT